MPVPQQSIPDRHAEITGAFKGLPDTHRIASYNYIDQLVMFEQMEVSSIRSAASAKTFEQRWPFHLDAWTNAWHEYRHWLDMTSSVFGLRWLNELVELIKADGGDVDGKAQGARRSLAEIHLPDYYSTVENALPRPWKYMPTVGQAFTTEGKPNPAHPIWFVRFSSANETPIARQPISPASLLEIRAVASEMVAGYSLLTQISNRDYRIVEEKRFGATFLERLYDPELTVYSAPTHWYANQRALVDAAEAYRASAMLAWFCLDAPSEWLRSLSPSPYFQTTNPAAFNTFMSAALKRGDRGALFFMLAADPRIKSASSLLEDLNTVLKEDWEITLAEVRKKATDEGQELLAGLATLSPPLRELTEIWKENFEVRADNEPRIEDERIRLPAIILADGVPLNPFRMKWGPRAFDRRVFDPTPYFDEFWKASKRLREQGKYTDLGDECFSLADGPAVDEA